jgi:hypothetical protein
MSDQKPKIDLKARLGKKPASSPLAGGSSIPPPMGSAPLGSAPVGPAVAAPIGVAHPSAPAQARPSMPRASSAAPQGIPAPALGSAIPVPQFGGARPPASHPYADAPAAPARPQAIRIEMGEEVVEAQRRGRKKVAILSLITAIIGGVVGFAVGGGAERAKGAEAAVQGASDLVKDIEKANAEVQKLADTLKAAKEKLSKGQFPEAEVSALGGINIPFDGKNLNGKGIGRFKPEVISMLISYAGSTTEANDQKEKLQNVLTGAKKGILELLAEKDKPQVRWSVIVGNGPGGPWASMQTVPTPFPAKDKWPEELKIGAGKDQVSLKRYSSGNPVGDPPYYIPVDPTSQPSVCPSDVIFKLRRELADLETVLRGDNTPGEDKPGLIDAARVLTEKLKMIGRES